MQVVLFDFDGTLVDSTEAFVNAWNIASTKYQFKPLQLKDVPSLLQYTIKERAAMYNFPMYKLPIIMPGIYKSYRANMELVQIKEHVLQTIERLIAKGVYVVILSSNKKENIEAFLHKHQIKGIQEILTSSKIFRKDAIMKKFIKEKKVLVTNLLYVGDEVRDIEACHKVGIPIAAVSWGYDDKNLLQQAKPTYIVNNFVELEVLLSSHFQ